MSVTDNAGLEFTKTASNLKAALQNAKPSGVLKLSQKPLASARMILESSAKPAFYLSDPVPEIAPRPRPTPGTVMLVWDASASGRDRDHKKEFALMDTWFANLGKTFSGNQQFYKELLSSTRWKI